MSYDPGVIINGKADSTLPIPCSPPNFDLSRKILRPEALDLEISFLKAMTDPSDHAFGVKIHSSSTG